MPACTSAENISVKRTLIEMASIFPDALIFFSMILGLIQIGKSLFYFFLKIGNCERASPGGTLKAAFHLV
jgi:hypothetical protein